MNRRRSHGRRRQRPLWQLILVVLLGLGYWAYEALDDTSRTETSERAIEVAPPSVAEIESDAGISPRLLRAITERESRVWVESGAVVTRLLADDQEGSRHQRLLVDVGGNSVLIAHNIDLAPRVPAEPGDRIVVRGRFEWNEKGGVVHWTHHDPGGRRDGGWIEHRGKIYR